MELDKSANLTHHGFELVGVRRQNPTHKSIAVLIDQLDHQIGGYEQLLRATLDAECARLGLNRFLFVGRPLDPDDPQASAHNSVYELVAPGSIDGVIAISGGLANHLGSGAVQRLAQKYHPLPMCSIAVEIPGVPSVVAENRIAMSALVEHLITVHRLSRLAFISGPRENPDSQLRREVFEEVLARHGIPVHDELMLRGLFTPSGGEEAVYELVRKGVTFDAVVCANDAMALGALEALRALGHVVPKDVALTGFDDVVQSRISSPALTTVRQPLDAMAAQAVRMIYDQMCGLNVPARVELPCGFLPRKSCGCGRAAAESTTHCVQVTKEDPAAFVVGISTRLASQLENAVRVHRNVYAEWATPLVDSLVQELKGRKDCFLSTLDELLDRSGVHSDIYQDFQAAITVLRLELSAINSPALEALWHEARELIAVANTRAHVRQRIELDIAYSRLLHSGEQFSTALTDDDLRTMLAQLLPGMDIMNACVSLRVPNNPARLAPFLCLNNGKRIEPQVADFRAGELLPPGMPRENQSHFWFVLPLTFESEPLGVAVLEFKSGLSVYEMLREQISAALKNVALHAEIVQKTALHERSVQERLAATDRMRSLSVLAGGVAHDLNNALGPLVALPDVIATELCTLLHSHGVDAPAIQADLAIMKSASLRAAQTIKDLLTLGRQGQAVKENFDLNLAIANMFKHDSSHLRPSLKRPEVISLELAPMPLVIHASESHVVRAVSNLVHNAVEALDGTGIVRIRTYPCLLSEVHSGFEPIDAGDYVVLAVADQGRGIAREDLSRVFEPFFSTKRLDETSGSGLGLAIVHGVVKEHHGFVDVHSELGSGTEFFLYFRRVDAPVAEAEKISFKPVPALRVLVVDDDPVQLRTAARVLTQMGHLVTAINSGLEAYSMMSAPTEGALIVDAPFDIVVIDMLLNEADDGLTIFEKIQRRFPAIRGIIVSGHSPTERTRLAVSRGLTWLPKPYTADALARSVRSALG